MGAEEELLDAVGHGIEAELWDAEKSFGAQHDVLVEQA